MARKSTKTAVDLDGISKLELIRRLLADEFDDKVLRKKAEEILNERYHQASDKMKILLIGVADQKTRRIVQLLESVELIDDKITEKLQSMSDEEVSAFDLMAFGRYYKSRVTDGVEMLVKLVELLGKSGGAPDLSQALSQRPAGGNGSGSSKNLAGLSMGQRTRIRKLYAGLLANVNDIKEEEKSDKKKVKVRKKRKSAKKKSRKSK